MCLPEEPELVNFGEDHEGSPLPSLENDGQGKRANGIKLGMGIQPNVQQGNVSPDMSAHLSPTMTASSTSSVVSSLASSAIKSKPPTGKH